MLAQSKKCNECGQIKSVSLFYKRSDRKNAYKSECIECILQKRENYRLAKGIQPYYQNKDCSAYLGIHVAERVLSNYFKHIQQMPMGNPGFDFICGKGQRIDVKSSTRHNRNMVAEGWQFYINHNKVPDYFLCIAFDNREDLNPEHVWLIPGDVLNDLKYATISETTLKRWSKWEKPIDKVISCCNTLKAEA